LNDFGFLNSTLSNSTPFNCEREGLKYVAGYVAHRFVKERPDLCQKTADLSAFSRASLSWISSVSRGGLVVPSDSFMRDIFKMEKIFQFVNKKGVSLESNVVKTFQSCLINLFPHLPEELLKKYARTRIFLRIRTLNANVKEAEAEKNRLKRQRKLMQFQK